MYLLRDKGTKRAAHIWNGTDTACRMWSTGGLNQRKKWIKSADRKGMEICTMCAQNTFGKRA